MAGKQVTELDALPTFTDASLVPVHNGAGLKKGTLTQLANYMGNKFSNPNLLINPDFKINQRGQTEYAYQTYGSNQYTVDRFRVVYLNAKVASDGLILNANGTNAGGGYISQVLENEVKGDTTLSFKVSAVVGTIEFKSVNSAESGNAVMVSSGGTYTVKGSDTKKVLIHITKGSSCKIEWIKLEQGSIATPFVAPNPTEELVKCQRYYEYVNLNCKTAVNVNEVFVYVPCVKKRINPTASFGGSTNLWLAGNEYSLSHKRNDVDTNNIKLVFAVSTNTWGVGFLKNMYVILDAEIY